MDSKYSIRFVLGRLQKAARRTSGRALRLFNLVVAWTMLLSQVFPLSVALAAGLDAPVGPAARPNDPFASLQGAAGEWEASPAPTLSARSLPGWWQPAAAPVEGLNQNLAPAWLKPESPAAQAPAAAALGGGLTPGWLNAAETAAVETANSSLGSTLTPGWLGAAPGGPQASGARGPLKAPGVCPAAANLALNLILPDYTISRGNAAGDVYTLTVRNTSAISVPEVSLLIDPNAGFYYLAGSATASSSVSGTLTLSAPPANTAPDAAFTLTPLGAPIPPQKTLQPGEIITLTFRLATDANAASGQQLFASLQSGSPASTFCKSTVRNVPTARGNLVVEKSPTVQNGSYGEIKTWNVTLKNTGLGMVYGGQFADVAGPGYIGLNVAPAITPVDLAPSQMALYTVTAQINACTNLTNTVSAWWSIGNSDGTATLANPLEDGVDILYLLSEPGVKVEMGGLPAQTYCGALSADIPITVTSLGPGPARNLSLIAQTGGVSISTSDPHWSQAGDTFTYLGGSPVGSLLAHQVVTFTLHVTSPRLCNSQTLAVDFTPHFQDACQLLDYSGVTGSASVLTANDAPSLELIKSGPSGTVLAGDIFTYEVHISGNNREMIVAPGVVVTDVVPANLVIQNVSTTGGPFVQAGQAITWTLPATATPGPYSETLYIKVRVPNQGELSCAAPLGITNIAYARAQGCAQCAPMVVSDTLTNRLNDYQPGLGASITRVTPPVELCAPPTTFSNLIDITNGITWANTIFSDTLGLGLLSQPLHVVAGSVKVLVNGADRTADVATTLGPPLRIDLSAIGTYSNTAQIAITYQVTASLGTIPFNSSEQTIYYPAEFRLGGSPRSGCPGGDLAYAGTEVRLVQGVLDFTVTPGDVLACHVNNVLLTVSGMNNNTLTNHMQVTFQADPNDIFTPTHYTLGGSFAGLTPTVLKVGNVVTFTFPTGQDYDGVGTIVFPLFRPCGVETTLQAGVVYQDRCQVTRTGVGTGGSTTLVSKVDLFVTPNKYTVNTRDTVWRFYVGNFSSVTAEDVIVTNTLPLGHKLQTYDLSSTSAPTNTVSMITGTLPSGQEVVTFTLSSLPPYGRIRFDVYGKIDSICNLPTRINIALLDQCGMVGEGSGVCQGRKDAFVDLLPGPAFLVTSNDQTAHLPLCETGYVRLTVKNSSASADEFNFKITDVLTNVTVTGPVTATVVDENGQIIVGETSGLPLQGVAFSPNIVTTGNQQNLTWEQSMFAPGTPGYDILQRRQASDVITIFMRVRTGCTGTDARVQSFVDARDVCARPLASAENAKTLLTDAPALNAVKRGYNVTRGYPLTNPVYAYPGDTLRWEVDVTNVGDQHVLNLWVTDTLPANFTYANANLGGAYAAGQVVWNLTGTPVLNIGETKTFVVTGTVTNLVCSDTQNRVLAVFGCTAGDRCSGLPANTDFTLQTRPNAFSLTSSGDLSTCGGLVTVNINNDGAPAANVTLTDTLPTGYVYEAFVSATAAPNVLPAAGAAKPVFGWTGANLLPRGLTTLVFRVRNAAASGACAAPGLPLTNQTDLNMQDGCGNNYGAANTTSSGFNLTTPNLSVTKTPVTQFRNVGDVANWTLTVRNTGAAPAPNVVITDRVGSNFGSLSASAGSFGGTSAVIVGNTIHWTPAITLPVGGQWTATVNGTLLSVGDNTNQVTATAACASGCQYAAVNTTAYVTLISQFDKGPNSIMTGTIGDVKVFTFTVGLPDVDGVYQNLSLVDTLPAGLGYVGSRVVYQQDMDNPTPPAPVIVTTPSSAPAYLSSGVIQWNLGTLNGVAVATGVITTVIRDIPTNYGSPQAGYVRLTNNLNLSYTEDGQPYTYNDTASADVYEPLLHLSKNYRTAQGCASALLIDNFNDGNTLGWTVSGGALALNGYTLQMPTGANRRALAGSTTWGDASFSAFALSTGVTHATDNDLGLILRANSVNTYYRLYWRRNLAGTTGAYRLDRVVGGTATNLVNTAAPAAYGLNRWYHLEARVQDYALQFYIDGALVLSYTDANAAHLAAGQSGLFTQNQTTAYFDDVLASRYGRSGCLVGAGDLVTYTLTISNQQVITAYNPRLVDVIPAGLSLQSYSWKSDDAGTSLSAGPTPVPGAAGSLTWDFNRLAPRVPFAANRHTAITMTVTLAVSPAITVSQRLANQAHLTYDGQAGAGPVGIQRAYDGGTHSNGVRTIDPYILKSSSPANATIGEPVYFTITVPSHPITATLYNITITDNVPANLLVLPGTVQIVGGTGVVNQTLGNNLRVLFGSIPAGTVAYIRYTAVVRDVLANQEGVVVPNTATLAWGTQTTTTLPVNVTLIEPSLGISKVVSPTNAAPGQMVFYTVSAYHLAGDTETAYNVTISDVVPASLAYLPGSWHIVNGPAGTASDAADPTLRAIFPVVGPTWTAANPLRLVYAAQVRAWAAPGALITNTARLTYTSTPTDTYGETRDGSGGVDDYFASQTADLALPEISVTKTGPITVTAGNLITYLVTVRNEGPFAAPAIVTDTLPFQVSFVSATPSQGSCVHTYNPTGGQLVCNLGSLAPGQATIQVVGRVDPNTPLAADLTNRVRVTTTSPDGATTNNTAEVDTEVYTSSDVGLNKSGPTTAIAGQTITYTIAVSNTGPSTAHTVDIKDLLPPGVSYVGASASQGLCVAGICQLGDLPTGQTVHIVVTATVGANVSGTLVNTAQAFSVSSDPNPANNVDTQITTVSSLTRLMISKVDLTDPVYAGDTYFYEVVITNTGPSAAQNVVISDTLPPYVHYEGASPECFHDGSPVGGQITCNLGTMAPLEVRDYLINVRVLSDVISGTVGINRVSATTTTPLAAGSVLSDQEPTTYLQKLGNPIDLSLLKSVNPASAVAGNGFFTYHLTATNHGPAPASDVILVDAYPREFSFISAVASNGAVCNQGMSCALGALAVNETVYITLVVAVPSDVLAGVYTNTARLTSPAPETDLTNNDAQAASTVTTLANLGLGKLALPNPATPGGDLTYVITVTNTGPSDAANVTVSDALPVGFIPTAIYSSQGNCAAFPCNLGTLTPGASALVWVVGKVSPNAAPGQVDNTANAASSTPGSGASDTVIVGLAGLADLALVKTGTPTSLPGGTVFYTLTLRNLGPSDATGVVLTDTLPVGLSYVSITPPAGCGYLLGRIVCTVGTLAANAQRQFVVQAVVDGSVPPGASLENQAAVTATSPDPNPLNNLANADTSILGQADLVIAKTQLTANPILAGTLVTYTIVVTNTGPGLARQVDVKDQLPAGLSLEHIAASSGGVCGGTVCQFGALLPGETRTITVTARVDEDAPAGTVTNVGAVYSVDESNPGNNTATTTTTLVTSADLSVAKVDLSDPVEPLGGLIYQLVASNAGPSAAQGVIVTDTLDANVVFVNATPGCVYAAGQVVCTVGTLAGGASASFLVAVTAGDVPSGTLLHNAALVAGTTPDGNPTNNQTTITTTVQAPNGPSAEVGIAKTGLPASVAAGDVVTYTLTVTNAGPQAATNVRVLELIPAGTTALSLTADNPDAGDEHCSLGGACYLGTVYSTTVATIQVVLRVNPDYAGNQVVNTASVSADQFDPLPGNNIASAATDVTQAADLLLAKSDLMDPVLAGDLILYQVWVTNTGPSLAQAVVVTDAIPVGTVFAGASPVCAESSGIVTCALGDLPAGAATSVWVQVRADQSLPDPTVVTNTARVHSSTPDSDPNNNVDSEPTTVHQSTLNPTDLAIVKGDAPDPVIAGNLLTYTLVVTNYGPAPASGVQVADALPSGTSLVSAIASQGVGCYGSVVCLLGDLAVNATAHITIVVRVDPNQQVALNNLAQVSSTSVDNNPNNNQAFAATQVETSADLQLTKTGPVAAQPGGNIAYQIIVQNLGPSDAQAVVVSDTLPLELQSAVASASQGACAIAAGVVTCNLGSLPAGGQAVIDIAGLLDPHATAAFANAAEVESATPDPNTGNNWDDALTTPTPGADLELQKTATPTAPAGGAILYNLRVYNHGISQAQNIVVTDTLPAGMTYASASPACAFTAGQVICTLAALDVNASVTFTILVTAASDIIPGTSLENRAVVGSSTPDSNPENNHDNADTSIIALADLGIDKRTVADPVVAGDLVTYTIVVTNYGPSLAQAVQVWDFLPAGVTLASVTPSQGICSLTVCLLGDLDVGATATLTLTGRINPNLAAGTILRNRAQTTSATPDPGPYSNTDTVTNTTTRLADLSLVKTHTGLMTPGLPFTYRLTVSNLGPSLASAVVVTDSLPLSVTFVSSTASCLRTASNPDMVACSLGNLAAGASASFDLLVLPDARLTAGTLTNLAQTASVTPDPEPTNNQTGDLTTVQPAADLRLSKSDNPDPVVAGQLLTYTLIAANLGPSLAQAVIVTDTLPLSLTYLSSSLPCSLIGSHPQVIACALGDLLPGATQTFQVVTRVDPGVPPGASLHNYALVGSLTPDTNPTNNVGSAVTTVIAQSDLAVDKTCPPDPLIAGGIVTYTVVISNSGPSTAQDVDVKDFLPIGLIPLGAHTTDGQPCLPNLCQLGDLQPGEVVTMVVTAQVDPSQPIESHLDNQATGFTDTNDPNPGNNSDSCSNMILSEARLVIEKHDLVDPVGQGGLLIYALNVTNTGPSSAQDVTVIDTLPAQVTYLSSTDHCVEGPAGSLTCSLGTILPNTTQSFLVTVQVPVDVYSGTILHNLAEVSSSTPLTDTSILTDSEDTLVIEPPVPPADLSIVKTENPAVAVAGRDDVTYHLQVVNHGPGRATDVEVLDPLPAGLTFVSAQPSQGFCWNAIQCSLGVLEVNASAMITVTAHVNADVLTGTLIANTAIVRGSQPDPDPTNNTSTTTLQIITAADLTIVKLDQPDPATPGELMTYTLAITNHGPSDAQNVLVTDPLPPQVSFVGALPANSAGPNPLTWNLGALAAGQTVHILLWARVDPSVTAPFTNTALVGSSTPEINPTDNSSSTTTQVEPQADLSLAKDGQPHLALNGSVVTYTLTVHNLGPSDVQNAVVTDWLPGEVIFVSAQPVQVGGPNPLTWNLGTLPVNATRQITVVVRVTDWATQNFTNLAQVDSSTPDPDPNNNQDDELTYMNGVADLSIVKEALPNPVLPESEMYYLLTVHNAGPSPAQDVVVSDTLPAEVRLISASPTAASGPRPFVWNLGTLQVGETRQITLTVFVEGWANGAFTNTAVVGSSTPDPDPEDNTSTSTVVVGTPTGLTLAGVSAVPAGPGQVRLEWTTLAEGNAQGFQVYRSASRDFASAELVQVVSLQGAGAHYQALDVPPAAGVWYYWLATVDASGRITQPAVLMVSVYWQYLPVLRKE